MTNLPADISKNLRFLVADVKNQLDELKRLFKSRSGSRVQRILDRRGYSENLMLRIQNACIQGIAEASENMIPNRNPRTAYRIAEILAQEKTPIFLSFSFISPPFQSWRYQSTV